MAPRADTGGDRSALTEIVERFRVGIVAVAQAGRYSNRLDEIQELLQAGVDYRESFSRGS